jgi:hypothetical protein
MSPVDCTLGDDPARSGQGGSPDRAIAPKSAGKDLEQVAEILAGLEAYQQSNTDQQMSFRNR